MHPKRGKKATPFLLQIHSKDEIQATLPNLLNNTPGLTGRSALAPAASVASTRGLGFWFWCDVPKHSSVKLFNYCEF